MSVLGYRVESSLLAIQRLDDGRSALRYLPSGAELMPVCPVTDGQLEVLWDGLRLRVFVADLYERAQSIALEVRTSEGAGRKPSVTGNAEGANEPIATRRYAR